jgi:hypothetical protein
MSVVLLVAGCIVMLLTGLAIRHRDQLKDGHNAAVRKAINAIAVLCVFAVVLHLAYQFNANRQGRTIRTAQLQHTVLQNLLAFQIELMDSVWLLMKHSATI